MARQSKIAPAPEVHLPFRSITLRYYCVWGFYSFAPSFIFAIYPLFLRSRGLNQLQVNTVAATYFLVTFLTDVPTGAFADAIGRRVSVVLGCALHAAAFILYFYSYEYWHFIAAEILDGVATTFGNGAIDAWAVDALDAAGFEGAKDRIFSRVAQIFRIGATAGAMIGAYSARVDLAIPFLLCAIGWIVAGGVGFILMDGPVRSAKAFSLRAAFAEVGRRMSAGTRAGFSTRAVFLLALASMISAAAWFPFWSEWQPYFLAHLGSRIEIIGWIFCLFSIAQIAGAEVASRMRWAREDRALYMTWNVGLSSAVLLAGGLAASKVGFAFAMFMVAQFLGGAAGPIEQSWFNEQIEGDNRATLLSFGSTFATFGATAGLPVQGLIVDKLGTGFAWQGAGMLAMLQVPVFLALRRKRG
ncbi:MAG TPA: MFS transporter [Sporolactobacillaceae bacterium]|nr:MFS transporter [Sporolactobacillaceae bacterium]